MKNVIITGSSNGFRLKAAKDFADKGNKVFATMRNPNGKNANAKADLESHSTNIKVVDMDVTNEASVKEAMASILAETGSVDVLINNAGITKDNLLMRMSEEEFDSVIDVNLKGTFNCMRHISRIMLRQRSGVIINISSITGVSGNAGQANYAASKAGVIGLTKSAAKELSSRNIRVNAIAPGFIQTAMTEKLNEKVKEKMLSNIPLQRYGSTEDVANLVVFLASDKSNYITGQVIHVDGGMVM